MKANMIALNTYTTGHCNPQERAVANSASSAVKGSRASAMAQLSDDRLAKSVTSFHIASVSQKDAAKSRSMRCVN
jgi:hypothetical protein